MSRYEHVATGAWRRNKHDVILVPMCKNSSTTHRVTGKESQINPHLPAAT